MLANVQRPHCVSAFLPRCTDVNGWRRRSVELFTFSEYLYVDVSTNAVAHRVDEYKYDIALKNKEKKKTSQHRFGV